jgi:preprotein translocase subunit YajC
MYFASAAATTTSKGGIGGSYLIFLLLIVAMIVWMFTQQSRQQKQKRQMQASIAVGDRVVTVGGIVGTVRTVEDRGFQLEVADGVTLFVTKSAIGGRYQDETQTSS